MGLPQDASKESQASKTRRSHKKSRKGCSECKRRHIRCDESRPSCTNCRIAERACSFIDASTPQPPTLASPSPLSHSAPTPARIATPHHFPHSPAESSRSGGGGSISGIGGSIAGSSGSGAGLPGLRQGSHDDGLPRPVQSLPSFNDTFADTPTSSAWSSTVVPPRASTFTPQHLMLLHHAETAMASDILWHSHTPAIVDIAIRHAVDCPYLIDELLAFAAIHLAHVRPESAEMWRHQATELQTRAVAYFAKDTEGLESEQTNIVPKFLFVTMLSLHVLAETLQNYQSDFDMFIDRYIECVQLHKGIRTVITPSWPDLFESELKPLLHIVRSQRPQDPSLGDECQPLHALIQASTNLDPVAMAGCREAAHMLQWGFDLSTRLPQRELPHGVSGFSIMIPAEFVEVLRRHVPEALVVMAYYGVLLHRTRKYWVCGNNGAFVIRAIVQRLGPQWEEALRWPLQVLVEEHD